MKASSWSWCPSACVAKPWASTSPTATRSSWKPASASPRHIKQLEASGIAALAVPDDYIVGRILSHDVVDARLAQANDEITDEQLQAFRKAGVDAVGTLWVNDLDRGPYLSNTLRIDPTKTQLEALVEIYRMMRPASRRPRMPRRTCSTTCSSPSSATTCPRSAA